MRGHGAIVHGSAHGTTATPGGDARRAITVLCTTLLLVATAAAVALAQAVHDVAVVDDAYDPPTVEITAGDTVEWTHTGSNPHTVTADDGSFDSHPECQTFADAAGGDCMGQGDTYARTFDEPGEYGYHCRIHGSPGAGMAGTVVVQAADEGPEDDDGAAAEADPAEGEPAEEAAPEDAAADELPQTGLSGILALVAAAALGGGTLLARRARGT